MMGSFLGVFVQPFQVALLLSLSNLYVFCVRSATMVSSDGKLTRIAHNVTTVACTILSNIHFIAMSLSSWAADAWAFHLSQEG